jgi:D-glycero-alpha-D-manno-heptose-7-phosphate kinase
VKPARVTARCRVDFGGGTLDIWPLGLLHPGAVTVNVAIDLTVSAAVAPRARGYRIESDGETFESDSIAGLIGRPATALVGRVVEALALPPATIETASRSPRGAGLGASSALAVALLAACEVAEQGGLRLEPLARARLARDLEARLMGLPTGLQDHLPAQVGGALALDHHPGGERLRRLTVDLDALGERLLVAYSGQSHFSAGANWSVVRRRLDGDPGIVERLDRVRDAARALPAALEAADWASAGQLMAREWDARRGLSPEVSTPQLEALLDRARALGAWGGKACGAGGGGCVAVLAPPSRGEAIRAAWRELGAQPLEGARPTALGFEID